MDRGSRLLDAVEAIHSAGLDGARWGEALEAVTRLTDCAAASLESYDFERRRLRMWQGVGSEPEMVEAYRSFHSSDNPYAPTRPSARACGKFAQAHVLDMAGLDREPFYAGYITYTEPRYFLAGLVDGGRGPQTVFTLTRHPGYGEVERQHARLFGRVLPHVRLALQVAVRMEETGGRARQLASALDWLQEGAALLGRDGSVLYANAALAEIGRAGDGMALGRSGLILQSAPARDLLAHALARAAALSLAGDTPPPEPFAAPRPSGAPAYVLTLRPLFPEEALDGPDGAVAVVFVHDPTRGARAQANAAALAAAWGLTAAEAELAAALRRGDPPSEYARRRGVSVNTVYTHLRRLKEKTGAHRLPELIRRLNESAPAEVRD